MADEQRFEIWGECESHGIESEMIDHASTERDALFLVGEYTMAFRNWYIWYVDKGVS